MAEHELQALMDQAIAAAGGGSVTLARVVAEQVAARLAWIAEIEAGIAAMDEQLQQQNERMARLEAQLPYLPRARQALMELVAALEQTRAELHRHAAVFPPGVAATDQWLAGVRRLIDEMAAVE